MVKFSALALTETWLKDNDCDNFDIPGYNLTKINRENKIGGGVNLERSNSFYYQNNYCNQTLVLGCYLK